MDINYEIIYDVLRKEKYNPELQKLDENFYKDVLNYLKEKESILKSQEKKESVFTSEIEKTKKQIENAKKLLKEIYERRESKIIQLAIASSRNNSNNKDSILPEELLIYEIFINNLNHFRNSVINKILNQVPKDLKTAKEQKTLLVRFLNPLPKFLGTDLTIYGPFKQEDIANIPIEIAQMLIRVKYAEELKENENG